MDQEADVMSSKPWRNRGQGVDNLALSCRDSIVMALTAPAVHGLTTLLSTLRSTAPAGLSTCPPIPPYKSEELKLELKGVEKSFRQEVRGGCVDITNG